MINDFENGFENIIQKSNFDIFIKQSNLSKIIVEFIICPYLGRSEFQRCTIDFQL